MEPTRNTHATLVDLLDRILDKGLVIHADVIVSVAGIPLIGVNLRAALAGMETMLQYGIMQAWYESTRAWEREDRKKKEEILNKIMMKSNRNNAEEEIESCPQCDKRGLIRELLEKGCENCGWVSPRLKKRQTAIAASSAR